MSGYADKFKDPRWQKKRLEILERDAWGCMQCGDTDNTLHVHHRYYKKGRDPWDYPDEALVTLCEECHEGERGFSAEFEIIERFVAKWCFAADIVPLWEVLNSWREKGKYPPEVILNALRHFFVLRDGLEMVMKLYWDILEQRRLKREEKKE